MLPPISNGFFLLFLLGGVIGVNAVSSLANITGAGCCVGAAGCKGWLTGVSTATGVGDEVMSGDIVAAGAENPSTDVIGAEVGALGSKACEELAGASRGVGAAGDTVKSGSEKGVTFVDEFVGVG